jgi:hypothetical protein
MGGMKDERTGDTMTDEPGDPEPIRRPAPQGRRFKAQQVALADGGKLVLRADGSIDQVDAGGRTRHRWTPDRPEWPDHAIRFGLQTQARTVAPHGRVEGTRPPRR